MITAAAPTLRQRALPLLLALLVLSQGCASGTTNLEADPHQGFNRSIWGFNMWLDDHALEPMARGWDSFTSAGVQHSISNFFDNLQFPKRFLGNLFELKFGGAGIELSRFVINTTVGLLGFFDPARSWGIEQRYEDFGLVFAYWGADSGSYWVLPFLGPSDTRDAIGLIFDLAVSITTFPPLWLIDTVNWRAENLERIATNKENALDFYVFVRNAYEQRRQDLVRGVKAEPDAAEEEDLYFIEDDDEDATTDAESHPE